VASTRSFVLYVAARNGVVPNPTQRLTVTVTKVATVPLPASLPTLNGVLSGVPTRVLKGRLVTVTGQGLARSTPRGH
jgi:hypothetical protein